MSTERIVVDAKIADLFVEKLAAKAKSLRAGAETDEHFLLGAVIGLDTVERAQALIE